MENTRTDRSYTPVPVGGDLLISGLVDFDLSRTFDCGQCFRFEVTAQGSVQRAAGVAFGRLLELCQDERGLLIKNCSLSDFYSVWERYLALDADYSSINGALSDPRDPVMCAAVARSRGIRILRQDGWETLCSFIISQNNNIPRIKKIIASLCEHFGEPFEACGEVYYSFPSAGRLAPLSVDDLAPLRAGFRAAYLLDAAKKVSSGEVDLRSLEGLLTPEASDRLCTIRGVGPKVAACSLLFGFDRGDSFPVDVWVKRVLAKYYPDGFDYHSLGKNAGIAQQYLFYYERYIQSRS